MLKPILTNQAEDLFNSQTVDLYQDLTLLPANQTKKDFCDDHFLEKTYEVLAFSFLNVFQQVGITNGVDDFKGHVENIRDQTKILYEKIDYFLKKEIEAKRFISPTYLEKVQKEEEELQKQGKPKYLHENTKQLLILSKEFMQRIQIDKQILYFSSTTQKVVQRYQGLFDQNLIQQEYQKFLQLFPPFKWLDKEYYLPSMRGLTFEIGNIQSQQQFGIGSYRFWSIKTYLDTRVDDDQVDISKNVQYLVDIKKKQAQFDQKILYHGSSALSELQIYACDLYASLLFEFQLLLSTNDTVQDQEFDANISLYQFIVDNFQTDQDIEGIPVCKVAIEPRDYFINQIMKLNIFKKNKNWPGINFNKIDKYLQTRPLEDLTGVYKSSAIDLYQFDQYIIDHLGNNKVHEKMYISEMRTILNLLKEHMKKTNHSGQQVDIVYEITIKFLQYLVDIQDHPQVKEKITEQGILRSMKFQYIVFTLLRLGYGTNGEDIYTSYDVFIGKFKQMFNRNMDPDQDDPIIDYIGRDEWETTIIITIEIITIVLEGNANYMKQIYQTMGNHFGRVKTMDIKPNGFHEETLKLVRKFRPIGDEDFTVSGIIYRVYIVDQVEEMIEYLTELDEDNAHNHFIKKQKFFRVLVNLMKQIGEEQGSDAIKQMFISNIQNDIKTIQGDKTYVQWILTQVTTITKDYYELYRNVYTNMYKYIKWRVNYQISQNGNAESFLKFLRILQNRQDVEVKYATSQKYYEAQKSKNLLIHLVTGESETCTYEDKWNEDTYVDALLLYPEILSQVIGKQGQDCESYDPFIMTEKEAEIYGKQSEFTNDIRNKKCINQREKEFQKFLVNEDDLDAESMTSFLFIGSLILSPEIYEYSEQFDFMIDAFQLFKHFGRLNDSTEFYDEQIENVFIKIYFFLIHIRSHPQFVYNGNFWETIRKHLYECMYFERYGDAKVPRYYCFYSYAVYNEMYWFIMNAEYEATNSFQVMRDALTIKKQNSTPIKEENAEFLDWGSRTNARFNQFTHYLMKSKIISQVNIDDIQELSMKQTNYNIQSIWNECAVSTKGDSALDFCKFLIMVAKIHKELDEPNAQQDKLQVVMDILKNSQQNFTDNDKIIAWEVLDFFYFEQLHYSGNVMENIRRLFDSEILSDINKNQTKITISHFLQIQNIQLLGEYAKSKYDENVTIRNLEDSQVGLDNNKQDNVLEGIVKSILANEQQVEEFLSLKTNIDQQKLKQMNQSQKNRYQFLFEKLKIVHYIPLSLLLYYSDTDAEFQVICKTLIKLEKLELLFFSNVESGQVVVQSFRAYAMSGIANFTKQNQSYTLENLKQFLGVLEKQISNNKKVDLMKQKVGINNLIGLSVQKTSKMNTFKHSLLNNVLKEKGGLSTHQSDHQVNKIEVTNENISEQDINKIPQYDREVIKQETNLTQIRDIAMDDQDLSQMSVQDNLNLEQQKLTSEQLEELQLNQLKTRLQNSQSFTSINSIDEQLNIAESSQNNFRKLQSFVTSQQTPIKLVSQQTPNERISVVKVQVQTQKNVIRIKKRQDSLTTQSIITQMGPYTTSEFTQVQGGSNGFKRLI